MTHGTHPSPFAALLRKHMDEQGVSVHALAKRMSGVSDKTWDGMQAKEAYRRKINSWLHRGVIPNAHSRDEIERALGLESGTLLIAKDSDEQLRLYRDMVFQLKQLMENMKVPA